MEDFTVIKKKMICGMKDYYKYLIGALAGAIIGILFYMNFTQPKVVTKVETKTEIVYKDTTINIIKHYDMPVEKLVENTVYLTDTIVRDSIVYIKDTLQTYSFKEEVYDIDIEAVKLNCYKLDIHLKENITVPTEINTTTVKNKYQSKVSLGCTFGAGVTYDMLNKNVALGPTAVVGMQVKF